jgi:hypothetical protein
MSPARAELVESIARRIADYRSGEIAAPTPEHVDRWVRQFEKELRLPILRELDHVLSKTYIPRAGVETFLAQIVKNKDLCGTKSRDFWKAANLLDIQQGGSSQRDMLGVFGQHLSQHCGLETSACGADCGPFIYFDDIIFSGLRVLNDLRAWLANGAPKKATAHVIVMAYHRYGRYYADRELKKAATAAGKAVSLRWWRCIEVEDRRSCSNSCEVLRPTAIPDDPLAQAYAQELENAGYPPNLREAGHTPKDGPFSGEEGRHLLEQQFLLAGLRIRSFCENPNDIMRPLGFSGLKTLGFGALVMTYRNCPNNCPLALWWGDPEASRSHPFSKWYPLLPRKVNQSDVDYAVDLNEIEF